MSSFFKRRSARAVIAATGFGLVVSPLAIVPAANANPTGTGLVISEVYGGGGATSGSPAYAADFVELYNPTDSAQSLSGLSLQYRSATFSGTGSVSVASLDDQVVPAKDHFLVQVSTGSVGPVLPDPDLVTSSALNMSASNGQVLLVDGSAPVTTLGDLAGKAGLVDMVGYGSTPTSYETARTGTALTNTSSASRSATGVDTDNNSADFVAGSPTPTAAAGDTSPPPPQELELPIAEIQGTDAAKSPHEGAIVTTHGVVTAAYPTGGYNGFYIQTPGTGGATDATPGASDAIFVYGSAATAAVQIGDHVEVTGEVKEFAGTTEIVPASASDVTVLTEPAVAPKALVTELPATEAGREAHEGELLTPEGPFTVTNTYTTNTYAEIGLAAGTTPLIQPTEVEDAQTGDVAGVAADNAARAITLDDGASANYTGNAKHTPLPWLSKQNPIRVGAAVTFTGPVVLEYRNNLWKFQPTSQITGDGSATATFANTRTQAPENVGGDIRLATFNVLNYFPTTGAEYVAAGLGTCTYYNDRDGNPVTVNSCTNNGPRGAANAENLKRQQDKIVAAINKLGASIVSLEEVENSVQFGKDRDFALSKLVEALNAAAGSDVWAFVPSPAAGDLPAPEFEDVIRTAFIYKPAEVTLVGTSKALIDEENFDNAREPLAQAFKPKGASDASAFTVIVNHFKSKGSGADDGTGQGNANPDRIGQAHALSAFADSFAAERGTDAVFLVGDFNAYSMEDPMQVLYEDGYTQVESDTEGEETYSFSGLSGSLDHVLANDAGFAAVTGADIWNINSPESVGFEYSRYNNNATDLYEADVFRASDHDPEIVGLDADKLDGLETIQVLGTNDFHGRLVNNPSGTEAGAAVMAGAVKKLRAENPNTVFAAAGDLIGASTFDSFIAKDKPTIDALNEAGLEVSAVGNHEFDAGYDDLLKRVMAPYDADTNPYGGAEWEYIGANVHKPGAPESELLEPTWVRDFGDVEVGFIGAVTEHLDELVSPAGIEGVVIEDIVTATNREADRLTAEGVDIVVLLVHEGAATTAVESATNPQSDFGKIVNGVDGDVDAIVSGHTHLAYNHAIPVQEWIDEGRDVTTRPVVSAGQYGSNLNQLLFSVDSDTGELVGLEQNVLALKTGQTANFPVDAATKSIVDAAVAAANILGAEPLGQIAGPFNRAKLANGTTENRGGESTAGNLVAEVQRWATESTTSGSAQIAFMNPGGLRADMVGTGEAYPKTLTYKQAAEVQPFANTLVNMRLTGQQIKTVLEEQWQPAGASRPFLKLGVSKGFSYTYDPNAAAGSRITGMWLNGEPINLASSYSVTANSFLASGGDNFNEFKQATQKRDTGKIDLQAMVDYMAEFASSSPVAADPKQRAVGISFPGDAPASYLPGDKVAFKVSSLAYSTAVDLKDPEVKVTLGDVELGTFAVDNTIGTAIFDEYGTANVDVTMPAGTPAGSTTLMVTGTKTGTSVPVTVTVRVPVATSVAASADPMSYGTDGAVDVKVTPADATGTVTLLDGETVIDTATLDSGAATLTVPGTALEPGSHTLTVAYEGDSEHEPSSDSVTIEVEKAVSSTTAQPSPAEVKFKSGTSTLAVSVSATGVAPSGVVEAYLGDRLLDEATLVDGAATLEVGPFREIGTKRIVVRYLGSDRVASSSTTTEVEVVRATPRGRVKVLPRPIHAKETTPRLGVTLTAPDLVVRGMVEVRRAGEVVARGRLTDGQVTLKLAPFRKAGEKRVWVRYLGTKEVAPVATKVTITVIR